MKFLELHLLAYGPFTDHSLDLSENSFHLVFGPNEAGKSSTLRAIDGLIFGIPSRTEDNFVHKYSDMKIAAKIANADGRELGFIRRKKQKKSLASFDAAEKPLAENALDAYLKGMERERFKRLYCIDHDAFRAGGELMRDLKGLANESLVAASHGGGFGDVESLLSDQAAELWSPRKRATKIKSQISEYDALKSERRKQETRVQEWKTLNDELEALQLRKQSIVEESTAIKAKQNRCKRLLEALPLIDEWKRLKSELDGQDQVRILPDSYSSVERASCEADLSNANIRRRTLDEKLCTLDSEIESSSQLPEVLEAGDAIDALQRRIESYLDSQESLAVDQAAMDASHQELQRWLDEMDSPCSPESANQLILKSEVRAAIEDLIPQEERLREQPASLLREQREKQRQLAEHQQRLESLGPQHDMGPLALTVREATQNLSLESNIVELERTLATQGDRIQRKVDQLPGWSGTVDQLTRCEMPLRETVDQVAKQRVQIESQISSLETQIKDTQRELNQVLEAIAASQRASSVVTEEDLKQARAERDHGWQLIKETKFRDGSNDAGVQLFAGPTSLDLAYEERVESSDTIADRLRREAERVGELTEKQELATRLKAECENLGTQLNREQHALASLDDDWNTLWARSGVENARGPSEMSAWLESYAEIVKAAEDTAESRATLAQQRHDLTRQIDSLRTTMAALADNKLTKTNLGDQQSLQRLHNVAESLLEEYRKQESEREQLTSDTTRLKSEIDELTTELEEANNKLTAWKSHWSSAMKSIGCDAEITAAQATARIRCLSGLEAAYREHAKSAARVTQAQDRIQRFETDVTNLTSKVAPECKELAAIDAAGRLKDKLQEARSLKQSADERNERRSEVKRDLQEANSDINQLQSKLTHFLALAGVETLDGLDTIERVSDLAIQSSKVEENLRRISVGGDFEAFVNEAESSNADELDAQISQLESEYAELENRRDEAYSLIHDAKAKRDEFDGNDSAAQIDQRAMNCLSQVHSDARQYLVLRIAETILRQQVERYREENKDPLLARASQYFAEMTCHEFSGVESNYDDQGQPILVGVRKNGEQVLTGAMSDGTLDPLFLSLRLAYLHNKLSEFEPMPLVVDDILIHLDDTRALATMKVLAEFSKSTQVLFFTHHQRLRELAETHIADDLLTVHELERSGQQKKTSRPR